MEHDTGFEARCLIRGARVATLATHQDGQPFASLATPATAPDLSILLWLSTLSEHTRQLQREPRCSLLFVGEAETANPQTAPRMTITGLAEQVDSPPLKARWLARHPYAALYADFGDFALWRVRPQGGLLVGGFARAARIRERDLLPDFAEVAAAEDEILHHVNIDHADAVAALARQLGGAGEGWRMAAVDVDGCDVALGDDVRRLAWRRPATTPDAIRRELIQAARAAREQPQL